MSDGLHKYIPKLAVYSLKRLLYHSFSGYMMMSLLILPATGFSAKSVNAEYQLKAALLYKLTKFVKWPEAQRNASSKPFGLCVLGENYFAKLLNSLQDRKVNKRNIETRYLDQSDAIQGNCDLVFISDSKKAFLNPILKSLSAQPVLTVGDMDNFANRGGMIQFTSGKRIGFKINNKSAQLGGLKIAAPLLSLATIVSTESSTTID